MRKFSPDFRYSSKTYAGNYKATIGADFHNFEVEIDGKIRSLEVRTL